MFYLIANVFPTAHNDQPFIAVADATAVQGIGDIRRGSLLLGA